MNISAIGFLALVRVAKISFCSSGIFENIFRHEGAPLSVSKPCTRVSTMHMVGLTVASVNWFSYFLLVFCHTILLVDVNGQGANTTTQFCRSHGGDGGLQSASIGRRVVIASPLPQVFGPRSRSARKVAASISSSSSLILVSKCRATALGHSLPQQPKERPWVFMFCSLRPGSTLHGGALLSMARLDERRLSEIHGERFALRAKRNPLVSFVKESLADFLQARGHCGAVLLVRDGRWNNPRSVESVRWRSRQLGRSAAMQFRPNFVQLGVTSVGTQRLLTAVPIHDAQKSGRRRNKHEREKLQSSCGRLLSSQR